MFVRCHSIPKVAVRDCLLSFGTGHSMSRCLDLYDQRENNAIYGYKPNNLIVVLLII